MAACAARHAATDPPRALAYLEAAAARGHRAAARALADARAEAALTRS